MCERRYRLTWPSPGVHVYLYTGRTHPKSLLTQHMYVMIPVMVYSGYTGKTRGSLFLTIYLLICSVHVLRHIQEYFTYTQVASLMVVGKQTEFGENSQPSWKTFRLLLKMCSTNSEAFFQIINQSVHNFKRDPTVHIAVALWPTLA